MGSDIDQVLNGELPVDKFCATRGVSPRTAYIWCLERCTTENQREEIKKKLQEYNEKAIGMME
jgi:hypothetical protein